MRGWEVLIVMPYLGGVLSVNRYRYPNSTKIRPEVDAWMNVLAEKAKEGLGDEKPEELIVKVAGRYKDKRVPDTHNLYKVICDGIARGISLDDRHYRPVDEGYHIDPSQEQVLFITLEPVFA